MDDSTNVTEISTQLLFVVKVKLPASCAFHSSPSGDTEYEQAYNSAIFAVKPRGFEVKWPKGAERWPVDSEGFTYVPLVLTDHRDALAKTIEDCARLRQRLKLISDGFDKFKHLLAHGA